MWPLALPIDPRPCITQPVLASCGGHINFAHSRQIAHQCIGHADAGHDAPPAQVLQVVEGAEDKLTRRIPADPVLVDPRRR